MSHRFLRLFAVAVSLPGLLTNPLLAQTTRYVSTTGTNNNPATATSWATSTTNLQGAIDASTANDQVWVATGLYKPTTNPANRDASFSLKTGVAVYGGFLGTEGSLGMRPSIDPIANQPSIGTPTGSTLSGDIDNNGMLSGNSYHVVSNTTGQTATALLNGFVIAAGNATSFTSFTDMKNFGGGMYNEGSSPTITNCVFTSNTAASGGGGSYNAQDSSPVLTRCLMLNNLAEGNGSGGGFSSNRSHPVLTSCTAVNNTAGYGGGGIDIYGNSFRVENCLIANNVSSDGGGVNTSNNIGQASTISPVLTSCTVVGNTASRRGGGIFFGLGVTPTLTDCFITSNTATSSGGGYDGNGGGGFAFQSRPNLTNCILRNNTASGSGGGLFYETVRSSLLTNCTFDGNTTTQDGGGVYMYQSTPTLLGCSFVKNVAADGGGMYNERSTVPTLTNCVFQSNSATTRGGGIHNEGDAYTQIIVTLNNCDFLSNSSQSLGGAISSLSSTVGLTNCKLHGNSAFSGGGIYSISDILTLIQCSFQGNSATNGGGIVADQANLHATNCSFQGNSGPIGGAILANNAQATQLTNCVFFGNGGTSTFAGAGGATIIATYSLFENTATNYTGTNNVITATNPFASATDTPLRPGSPAIDAGLDSAPGLSGIKTDLAGNPRFVGVNCRVDMGAYEFQQPNSLGNLVAVVSSGTLSCASPTVSLTAIGGTVYGFSGPAASPTGVVSQFDGSERVYVNGYLITRTPFPITGTAVVNKPGVYTIILTGNNGCSTTATFTVSGVACP